MMARVPNLGGRPKDYESIPLVTCTTWIEFRGRRFGEQCFVLDTGVPDFADFLESLSAAQRSHPGFRAQIDPVPMPDEAATS